MEFCSIECLENLEVIKGPVVCLFKVTNNEEAAKIANKIIESGIGATSCIAVFSNNLETISNFTKKAVLKSNLILVNSLDDTPLRVTENTASHMLYTNPKSVYITSNTKDNKRKLVKSEQKM